jgi:hypothetical protein
VLNDVDDYARSKDSCRARLQQTTKALPYPTAGMRRCRKEQAPLRQFLRAQGLEPQAICGLVYGLGKFCLHLAPDVFQLDAHGSV